jgi:hypothetical protein
MTSDGRLSNEELVCALRDAQAHHEHVAAKPDRFYIDADSSHRFATLYAKAADAIDDMRQALESVCAQLVVQMEWIDNHAPSFRDDGEYMGDTSLAREALAEAAAALKALPPQQDAAEVSSQEKK